MCSLSSHRISSISNAAVMVSMRTVARIEPRSRPRRSSAVSITSFQTGLEMALQLREVVVGAEPPRQALPAVVEHVQAEVEQARRDPLALDGEVLLLEVPAPGA